MTKITTVLAILFLSLSLTLAILRSHQAQESIFDKTAPVASPLGLDPVTKPQDAQPQDTQSPNAVPQDASGKASEETIPQEK